MAALLALFLACSAGETPRSDAPGAAAPAAVDAAEQAGPATDASPLGGGGAFAGDAPVLLSSTAPGEGLTDIRIGWQTTWATQGQLVAVLLHTDILARNGFVGHFRGYPYGAPLNDAARAGEVDALFAADQPALALAASAPSWGIVGRLMYNRVGTIVPNSSTTNSPRDLAGKTLAVPFGAAAQREAMEALQAEGLDPVRDVTLVDRSVAEIRALVHAGAQQGRWGEVDAAAVWDPTFAELEHRHGTRIIASSVVTGVVMMRDAYVAPRQGVDARFLTALAMAWDVYRADPRRADRWYLELVKAPVDVPELTAAATVEPNLSATSAADLRLHLTDSDVADLREASAYMHATGLLAEPLRVESVLRPSATRPVPPVDTSAVAIQP